VLAAVAAELRATLLPCRVQKVRQPSGTELVLDLYGKQCGAKKLFLSADPKNARIYLTQVKRESPTLPPGFCQIARKYLEGAWLEAISLPYFDRILHLEFKSVEGEPVTLVIELMGRNSNVVLSSGAGAQIVRGVLRDAREGVRDLRHGLLYEPPPGVFQGLDAPLGKFADTEAQLRGGRTALLTLLATEQFSPHSVQEASGQSLGVWAFEPLSLALMQRTPEASISLALDRFWATQTEENNDASERLALTKEIATEIQRCDKVLADQLRTLTEAERADEYEQSGNLLLAALGQLTRGMQSVCVTDFYSVNGSERQILLDPKKSPQENAESYFDRARKARDAAEHAARRFAETKALKSEWEKLKTISDLPTLSARVSALRRGEKPLAKQQPKPGERKFDGHKIRTYILKESVSVEWTLLIGENATSNDYLLTRLASPSDLWMHVRGDTGAHGVLRTNNHPERISESIIRKAASIVAARSGSEKHAGLVPVDITQRRYVRKPRGAKPGLALYTQARTIDVEPDLA
jgi:predicted ribosome quality control (RQC) complex YloA/Tae2 family protein